VVGVQGWPAVGDDGVFGAEVAFGEERFELESAGHPANYQSITSYF
jgi:hypothetical protein